MNHFAPSRKVGRVLVFLLLALAAAAQQPPPPSGDPYRLRVDVQLVMVSASVSTPDGKPVTTLDRDAFEILENGRPRPLKFFDRETALPLQLVLLVDASLSAASELPVEKKSMARFIQQVLRPTDAASLYEFSGGARALTGFSADPGVMERALDTIRPRAGTALYDAVVDAADKLKSREGRRVLVLVTDGNDTSSEHDFHQALSAVQGAEASIFALIIRPIPGESGRSVRGEHAMMTFADMTGGRVFFVSRAAEMDRFFAELNGLLRTQYVLGFVPAPGGAHAEFRSIKVRVKGADYLVQHRKGYYAEAAP